MATLRQRTSFGPGIYRGHAFTADRLKSFVDGTNAAIAAGVPIPLLMKHAPINANDGATKQFADEQGAGWVTKVFLDENNHIGFEADAVPSKIAEDSKVGTLKFTSPEFRPHYECEKSGVYSGPVIRHFAFTPTPGNPHQGPIEVLAMSEACIQLSEADYQGPVQHAELSPVEAPSINAIQDNHYKDTGVPYPKHTDDAADDKDHDTNDMANGEGNSLDTEELVNDENKPKKKKGTKNDNDEDDLEHEQEMDKDTNKDVDTQHEEETHPFFVFDKSKKHHSTYPHHPEHGQYESSYQTEAEARRHAKRDKNFHVIHKPNYDTQHSETVEGEYHGASYHAKQFQDLVHKHGGDSEVYKGAGRATGKKFKLPKSSVSEFHRSMAKDIPHYKEGSHYTVGSSQHAEKNKDGFGSPENDTPNAPSKQPVNDPNLEVMENPEAPVESAPPENPDMPPKATDKSKLAAIVAGFGQLGLVVPSDWDPSNEGAMDILLGCLNTHIKTKQDTEAEESVEGEGQEGEAPSDAPMPFSEETPHKEVLKKHGYTKLMKGVYGKRNNSYAGDTVHVVHYYPNNSWNHSSSAGKSGHGKGHEELDAHLSNVSQHTEQAIEEVEQFSEAELAAMPAKARKVIEAGQVALKAEREARIKAEQEAIAFAEQEKLTKAMAAKGQAIANVHACPIPPALKSQLLANYQNLQFSEAKDEPTYTGEQVAQMVAACIPPHLQFSEEQTSEGTRPSVSIKVGVSPSGEPIYKQLKDAEQFFEDSPAEFVMTKERANEIANATVGATQTRHTGTQAFSPTIPTIDRIAAENQRHPNRVRNW